MASLIVRVGDAMRRPLPDTMDVHILAARTNTTVRVARGVPGHDDILFEDLPDGQPYVVQVFPMRHRPVAQFAMPGPGSPAVAQLYAPLDPQRVTSAKFPDYAALPAELCAALERSMIEGVTGSGETLYVALGDTLKAGLLNLFSKMNGFGFDDKRTVWSFVDRLTRIRADRIFADVQPALRDMVKSGVAAGRFRVVSGSLHTPPPNFVPAGSFKTLEQYGNLQLTFFVSALEPLAFKVDADIDDAAGLGHVFQVLRNSVTHGTTHPYDIHEILVFRQEVALPYELA